MKGVKIHKKGLKLESRCEKIAKFARCEKMCERCESKKKQGVKV